MDLRFTEEERAFRDEVRAFFHANVDPKVREKLLDGEGMEKEDIVNWQRTLNAKGWAAPAWPVEYGGTGWDAMKQYIFLEEMQKTPAPQPLAFNINMVGPVIYTFGNAAQKAHYLPRILNIDDWWCQGFSEPGAGSDLASLKTKAVRDGDAYIVNGQKTWTTLAQHADWIFCLVRTDPSAPKPQMGISFLLIDMKTPGIEVRPIVTIDGGREINEVLFTAVRVPAENLVGEENRGWDYAKFLLGHERVNIARIGMSKQKLARIRELAGKEMSRGAPLIDDPRFREKLAQIEIDLKALEITQMRVIANEHKYAAQGRPDPASSILKIRGSELQQATTSLMMEVMGPYAMPYAEAHAPDGWNELPIGPDYAAPASPAYFNFRKVSIYGGSNEIQKNIIAKAVLGL
ncbi:MAG TPA: pimeloyl-CoA dehydrogenase large subunit [Rhizobiaceae bacterium]|nr:pimeloyl-CoA dehydrogenase large subunit [Rhizobiaceae bacterium]